jgi:hypothetical protein
MPTPVPRSGPFGDLSGRFPAKAPSCVPFEWCPFPSPAVSSFLFAWRRKTKKRSPETAKLLRAVLTTATAMSLRFTGDDGMDPGEAGEDVAGGGAIVGGVAKAGVRVDGNRVWMLRGCCCAAASGARARTAKRRRSGRGAIAGSPW